MASEEKESVGLDNLGDYELAEIVRGGIDAQGGLTEEAKIALRELDKRTSQSES